MKITFLLTQSLESPSGIGRYWPLSKELVRLGHEVVILALHHNFRALGQRCFVKEGVRVCYVGQMHVRKVGNLKYYFSPTCLVWIAMFTAWQLARAALQVSSDLYHIGKPHPMNGVAALLARYLKGAPIYLDCDDYEAASNRFEHNWQRQIVAFFEDKLPAFAAGITVNTRFTLERLKGLGYPADRIVYVPNGVDRQRFSNVSKAEMESLRRRIGLADRKIVMYVGSLSLVSHAVDLLLEAFALAWKTDPRLVLLLVGGGEDYNELKDRVQQLGIAKSVLFTGRVPPEEVPGYFSLATVSVDPVRDDPIAQARSPLKVVESLVMGVPVVTGDVGDRRALLDDGKFGILVTPGDSQALADGLLAILRNPNVRARIVEAILSHRERWYWDQLIKEFVQVYGKAT